jgi:hypothetical protein
MLNGNLATRPFYNESVVSVVLLVVALGVAYLTYFNVREFSDLWRERARLEGEIQRDEAEVDRVLREVESSGQVLDAASVARLGYGTAEANRLIEARRFSWTTFFDVIEDALPFDVRLVAVAHRVEDGDLLLVLTVVARDDPDLNTFISTMLATGRFLDVIPTEKMRNDDGSMSAAIQAWYVPLVTDFGADAEGPATGGHP